MIYSYSIMLLLLLLCCFSCVRLCATPKMAAQGIFQARVLEWGAIAFSNNIILSNHKKKRI